MRVLMVVASSIGLMMAVSTPIQAGNRDGLENQTERKLLAQARGAIKDDSPVVREKKKVEPPKVERPKVERPKVEPPKVEPPKVNPPKVKPSVEPPPTGQSCKDLGLRWITPWTPKLLTLRKLPAWADYELSISDTGEVQSADLLDASAKAIFKLGASKKVVSVLLAQRIVPTGSAFQCHETLYFYRDAQNAKTKMPASRCGDSQAFCVKN